MKFYTLAAACLAFGLLASVVSADEKPQRAERRNSGAKPGGPSAKEPAEMASKMLSEFDSDGDSLLNARELTAMFTAMRERSLQAKAGQGRPGQVGSGRGRVKPGRVGRIRGSGVRGPRMPPMPRISPPAGVRSQRTLRVLAQPVQRSFSAKRPISVEKGQFLLNLSLIHI